MNPVDQLLAKQWHTPVNGVAMKIVLICMFAMWGQAAPPDAPPPGVGPLPPSAPPAQPAKTFPPRIPVKTVVADFLKAVESDTTFDEKTRSFVAESAAQPGATDSPDFITQSLAVLSPAFKSALDLEFDDKALDAAAEFEVLSRESNPFLAVAAANLAATTLIDQEQIERALEILTYVENKHTPIEQYTTAHDRFLFMRGVCQVHALNYEGAIASLEEFAGRYPDAPERLRVGATQILTELSRRSPGRIGDVRDLLGYARRRIHTGETGKPVIDRQKEAVALLDALIEEAEEQEKNQGGGGDGDGSGGGGGGAPQGNQQPGGSGANQSNAPGGEQRDANLRKKIAKPGDAWGRMPPRERDQILQALQKQYPSQYRELLEQYYRQLSKDAGKP